jgi:hypothetical protein
VPPNRVTAERTMMLSSAGGTASTVKRRMNFIDLVEALPEFGHQEPAHTRTRGRSDHEASPESLDLGIVPEEFVHVIRIVGGGHHIDATSQ